MVGGVGGRTDGGMCGQLLEGDGSPGWVDDDPKQAHTCAKTRKFDEVGEKAELLGEHMADRRWHWGHMTKKIAQMDDGIVVGDQIGCAHAQNIEKSMKIDENWVKNVGNRVG